MSREVVHAGAHFGKHFGLRVLERQRQLDPRRPAVAAATELRGELRGIDLVTAANAHFREARTRLFEEDGELLAADRVQLVDGAVGLVGRRAAVAQPGLADRTPDEAVAELIMQPLQDSSLHPQPRGRPALEEAASDRNW